MGVLIAASRLTFRDKDPGREKQQRWRKRSYGDFSFQQNKSDQQQVHDSTATHPLDERLGWDEMSFSDEEQQQLSVFVLDEPYGLVFLSLFLLRTYIHIEMVVVVVFSSIV